MTDYQEHQFRPLSWEETQQPFFEGEYTVEESPHVHDRPEWQVWAFFGEHKFQAATQRLHFLGERNGRYHYRDLRDGEEYSVPNFERVKEYFKEQRLAEVYNAASWKNWKLGWQLWALALGLLFAAMWILHAPNQPEPVNTLGVIWFAVFLVGGIALLIGRSGTKRRPRELPEHRMFYTDAELAELQRQQNVKNAIAVAMIAGYAAHKYHQHSQERLAHLIVEEQQGHGLYGSEWHQY